jgi:hypothetical protein
MQWKYAVNHVELDNVAGKLWVLTNGAITPRTPRQAVARTTSTGVIKQTTQLEFQHHGSTSTFLRTTNSITTLASYRLYRFRRLSFLAHRKSRAYALQSHIPAIFTHPYNQAESVSHTPFGMAAKSASSSISVTVRVRPFTIREAAQLSKCDDTPLFLGDGSLAGVPSAPKLAQRGIRPVIKVVDDRCL